MGTIRTQSGRNAQSRTIYRLKMINTFETNALDETADLISQELGIPLGTMHRGLNHIKGDFQEYPDLAQLLEYSITQIEQLMKAITDLDRMCG